MKRIIILSLLMFQFFHASAQFTPNCSNVGQFIVNLIPLTQTQINTIDSLQQVQFPSVVRIQGPTTSFNCHNYAFVKSEGGSEFWLNTPGDDAFWDDGSYVSTSIITQANLKVSYQGDHTGVTTATLNEVISKWGPWGLYRHNLNYVPAVYLPNNPKTYYRKNATIQGPTLICNNATFGISNSPSGSSISWSSSNPTGLNINQSTGFASRVSGFSGSIVVKATITSQCGSVNVIESTIWVGTPHITNMRVNNQPVWPGQNVALCPGNHFLNVTPTGGNAGTATWTVPASVPHWIGNNTMDFTFPSSMSSITISARSSNFCGQGANYTFFLTKQTWGCPSSFAMVAYPNPTSDLLNIEMAPTTDEASGEDAPTIESAVLLNGDGREVAKGLRE